MTTTKAKIGIAGVMVLLLGGASFVAYRVATIPAVPVASVGAMATTEPEPSPDWHVNFNKTYALAPGEVFRHIKPPYIPERQEYWNVEKQPEAKFNDVFLGNPLNPSAWFMMSMDDSGVHVVADTLGMADPSMLIEHCVGLSRSDYDASSLPIRGMPGDWVVRKDASVEQKLQGVSAVLTTELGQTVRFEKRPMDRDVVIVTGTYNFHALPNSDGMDVIEFTDGGVDKNKPRVVAATLGDLFQRLQSHSWVTSNVIDETGQAAMRIEVRYHEVAWDRSKELLDNLTAQTGLIFTRQRRAVVVWRLIDQSGQVMTNPVTTRRSK